VNIDVTNADDGVDGSSSIRPFLSKQTYVKEPQDYNLRVESNAMVAGNVVGSLVPKIRLLLGIRCNHNKWVLLDHRIMISSISSPGNVLKHSTIDSRVRHVMTDNTALSAHVQNRVKIAAVTADTQAALSSREASSPASASCRSRSRSRSRWLHYQM
jgi:hypothetical protein